MIVHVLDRAREAEIGPVVVAAAEPEIVTVVEAAGGRAVLTDPDHASGSDRIAEAVAAAGADALSVCNTIRAFAIDIEARRPRLGNRFGGPGGAAQQDTVKAVAGHIAGTAVVKGDLDQGLSP